MVNRFWGFIHVIHISLNPHRPCSGHGNHLVKLNCEHLAYSLVFAEFCTFWILYRCPS